MAADLSDMSVPVPYFELCFAKSSIFGPEARGFFMIRGKSRRTPRADAREGGPAHRRQVRLDAIFPAVSSR
jgi:hypothetical protein